MIRQDHGDVARAMAERADSAALYHRPADLAPRLHRPVAWVYGRLKELRSDDYADVLPNGATGSEQSYFLTERGRTLARQAR